MLEMIFSSTSQKTTLNLSNLDVNTYHFINFELILGIPRPAGKGPRCIIMAMGTETGFIEGSVRVWKHKKDGPMSQDYHADIDAEGFTAWLKECLPKLPPHSVLVFDNASYHSKKLENCTPRQSWRKEQLKTWLEAKNVVFPVKAKKPELWQLARAKAADEPRYHVDDMIREAGHDVLRLPPYHCDLNPIERI